MANISPKLFQKAIQQGLKAALFTTSTAAIMLSSSGALGVAAGVIATNNAAFRDNVNNNNWNEITAGGVANGTPAGGPQDNWAFTYGGNYAIDADVIGRIIMAINVADTNPVSLNIMQNTTVGSIITRGNLLPVTITAGQNLTLNGTNAIAANHGFDAPANNYTGLGNIFLEGVNAGIIIDSKAPAKITLAGNTDGGGIVTFTDNSTVTGDIGNTNALAKVNVGAGLLQVQGGVVKANRINLTDNASAVTFTNPVVVTGAIDNTGNANNGIVTFTDNSTVTGDIGNTNALAKVNVGAGLLQVQGGVVKANKINLTDNASAVTFTNPVVVTGEINNTGKCK